MRESVAITHKPLRLLVHRYSRNITRALYKAWISPQINGKSIEGTGISCKEAQKLLDAGVGDVVQITTLKALCSGCSHHSTAHMSSSSSSGHNLASDHPEDGDYHDRDPFLGGSKKSSSGFDGDSSSGICGSSTCNSREALKKLMPNPYKEDCIMASRKCSSTERGVYHVTNSPIIKGSGKWDQIKNIVKPRRHSKERISNSDSKEKGIIVPFSTDQDKDKAIAQLDSVLSLYHHKSSGGSGSSTAKSPKKREKEKSGGTWPKYKGGALSAWDPDAVGAMNTQPRRERVPLLLHSPSNPTRQEMRDNTKEGFEAFRSNKSSNAAALMAINTCSLSSSPHSHNYHKEMEDSGVNQRYGPDVLFSASGGLFAAPHSKQSVYGPGMRPNFESKSEELERENRLGSLTPSDTSLDFSVRSGNVGKEELEYYVKKNIVKCPFSDSESNVSPVDMNASPQPLSLPTACSYRSYPLRQLQESQLTPTFRLPLHTHTGLYSPSNTCLRNPPSFIPYSSHSHYSHHHPHTTPGTAAANSSPRYSSPPTLPHTPSHFLPPSRSGDSLLSSPGPDRDPRDGLGHYEQRLLGSPVLLSSSPSHEHVLNKLSGKSGPATDCSSSTSLSSNGKTKISPHPHHHHHYLHKGRPLQSHSPALPVLPSYAPSSRTPIVEDSMLNLPLQPSASLLLPPTTCPPSYQDYHKERAFTTMPRKRDEDKIRWVLLFYDPFHFMKMVLLFFRFNAWISSIPLLAHHYLNRDIDHRLSATLGGLQKSASSERNTPVSDSGALHDSASSPHGHHHHRHSSPPASLSTTSAAGGPLRTAGGQEMRQIYFSVHNRHADDYQWFQRRWLIFPLYFILFVIAEELLYNYTHILRSYLAMLLTILNVGVLH